MELFEGRPVNTTGRLPREVRVYDLLDELGIEYLRVDHEPATTMEACEAIDEAIGTLMCKNLFLCNRQQTMFYLLMMPGHKPFKTKELSSQIHSARLSFGSPEQMEAMLETSPGSASIMGLMNDKAHRVQLLIDADVAKEPYIGCHPCVNTSSLKIRTSDILERFLPATGHVPTIVSLIGE